LAEYVLQVGFGVKDAASFINKPAEMGGIPGMATQETAPGAPQPAPAAIPGQPLVPQQNNIPGSLPPEIQAALQGGQVPPIA
jgi:hypothetical protein